MARNKTFTSSGVLVGPKGPIGGMGSAIGKAMVGSQNDLTFRDIIADGKNLVLCFNSPASKGKTYFCLKNIHLKDFQFNICHGDLPRGNLDFSFFDSETKSFDIPDHIPKEQHNQYIMEQFDLEDTK